MKWSVDRKQFTLWIEHGLVKGSKTWSETHVSGGSNGGGGFVSGGSGYVSTPGVTITSSVRTRNTFFLKADNGKEFSADIDGTIPLCDGQPVSVVYVKRTDSKNGYPLIIANHSTGEVFEIQQNFSAAAGQYGCTLGFLGILFAVFAGVLVGAAAGTVLGFPLLEFIVPVGAVYLVWQHSRSFNASRTQLLADARQLAEQTYARKATPHVAEVSPPPAPPSTSSDPS